MKTILDPSKLEWHSDPLPSASLCNFQSKIVVWNVVQDSEYIETSVLSPHPTIKEYWIDYRGKVWAPSKFKLSGLKWAWLKRF